LGLARSRCRFSADNRPGKLCNRNPRCPFTAEITQSRRVFRLVNSFTAEIRQEERSGAFWNEGAPGKIALSKRTAFRSQTWVAGTLVHEAQHLKQYQDGLFRDVAGRWSIPGKLMTAREAECISVQVKTLRDLAAPPEEIRYAESQDGKHWDMNGDDQYDQRDWELISN